MGSISTIVVEMPCLIKAVGVVPIPKPLLQCQYFVLLEKLECLNLHHQSLSFRINNRRLHLH